MFSTDKSHKNKESVSGKTSQLTTDEQSIIGYENQHAKTLVQKKLQEKANNSITVSRITQLQALADKSVSLKNPIQLRENNTGLPDNLKTGMENLSGISLDDVKVHRNSDKPAQLNAHAYAQGTDIHIGAGQEKYLPHEAWHVVQQKQGRVKPTIQMKGKVNINDDIRLEKEADLMGEKALNNFDSIYSKTLLDNNKSNTIQREETSDFEKLKEIGADVKQGERKQKTVNKDGEEEEVSKELERNNNKKQIVPVFAQAFEMLPSFTSTINSIAAATGGEAVIPPLKGFSRAREKADDTSKKGYKGDTNQLTDLLRCSIKYLDPRAVLECYKRIEASMTIIRVKNKFNEPDDGYRDLNMNVKLSNGHVAEIQIHILGIIQAKMDHGIHELYEVMRGLKSVNEKGVALGASEPEKWKMAHEDGRINKVKEEYPNHMQPAIDASTSKRDNHDYKTLKEFSAAVFNLEAAGKTIMDARAIVVREHEQAYDAVWDQLENIS